MNELKVILENSKQNIIRYSNYLNYKKNNIIKKITMCKKIINITNIITVFVKKKYDYFFKTQTLIYCLIKNFKLFKNKILTSLTNKVVSKFV